MILPYFNVYNTLSCGQIFRFWKIQNSTYKVISGDKICILTQLDNSVQAECGKSDEDYFNNFFYDSNIYTEIYTKLNDFSELKNALEYSKGIIILKQVLFETIISFIISANNNIKRITNSINAICQKFGNKINDTDYAFPTLAQLSAATTDDYVKCGLGYRAGYLVQTVKTLVSTDFLQTLTKLTPKDAFKKLMQLKGVGAKVANCIMLFGLGFNNSYPVDTHIFRANKTDVLDTKVKVQNYFSNRYGALSGYAQQVVFYNQRRIK